MDEERAAVTFGPPGSRLAQLAPGARPPDRISLTGHVRQAEIGAFEAERGAPQRLRFDIAVEVDRPPPGDDVDRILSYDRLAEAVDEALAQGRVALLETLAEEVAARVLAHPQARRVLLRIRKLDRGPGELGVEAVRDRSTLPRGAAGPAPLPFRLVLLDPGADLDLAAAGAGRAGGLPSLLCPSAPAGPRPRAATPEAQGRIDLLALDQGAWMLAATPGLAVVATRTEMDWHLRRGLPAVLAPARMMLDMGLAGALDGLQGRAALNLALVHLDPAETVTGAELRGRGRLSP